jgi:threonine dehydrogenase-like Zn-dependent dehydrogenase
MMLTTALKVQGVELVACCDLYDGRLAHAKELYGNNYSSQQNTMKIYLAGKT